MTSEFDSSRRCHLHAPVRNTLSIVATVIRRREQVVFGQFKQASSKTLAYVSERYGERDPRVMTLRSIVSTCEIAEAVMQARRLVGRERARRQPEPALARRSARRCGSAPSPGGS